MGKRQTPWDRHHRADPQALSHDTPNHPRLARANMLRGKRRGRHNDPKRSDEDEKKGQGGKGRRGQRVAAKPADHHSVCDHHRDLAQLGQHNGSGETKRLPEFISPSRLRRHGHLTSSSNSPQPAVIAPADGPRNPRFGRYGISGLGG